VQQSEHLERAPARPSVWIPRDERRFDWQISQKLFEQWQVATNIKNALTWSRQKGSWFRLALLDDSRYGPLQ